MSLDSLAFYMLWKFRLGSLSNYYNNILMLFKRTFKFYWSSFCLFPENLWQQIMDFSVLTLFSQCISHEPQKTEGPASSVDVWIYIYTSRNWLTATSIQLCSDRCAFQFLTRSAILFNGSHWSHYMAISTVWSVPSNIAIKIFPCEECFSCTSVRLICASGIGFIIAE